MKYVLLFGIAILFLLPAQSQNTPYSAGYRFGETSGIVFKYNFRPDYAVKAIVGGKTNQFSITALAERYQPALVSYSENFFWYYGVGCHIGTNKEAKFNLVELNGVIVPIEDIEYKRSLLLGVDAIVGLEYRLSTLPISFGIDVKPSAQLSGIIDLDINLFDTGFIVQYNF